jgi:hypothetical protein
MILVDTSVIIDILTKDPDWFGWSSSQGVFSKMETTESPALSHREWGFLSSLAGLSCVLGLPQR